MERYNILNKLGYRRIILDYHFSEYPLDVLSKVDATQIVESMINANATSLLMYTKDHWGNIYSETAHGHKHKNVNFDLFGRVLEVAKEKGLVVYAYYTVCWDEYYARNYTEWCSRDKDGNIICNNGTNRWSSLCINSPYRDITYYQIQELVKNYDFPVLFVDLVNYYYGSNSAPCHCEYCKKIWKLEFGYDMPGNLEGAEKLKYLGFRDKFVRNYLRNIKGILQESGKEIALTHNFGVDFEFDDYLSKEAEPWGFDYYSGSVTNKVFRSFADGKTSELITARFNQFWDFTIKSENQLMWEGATTLAHNQALLLIDQPNIDGTVEQCAVHTISRVFEEISVLEPYVKGTSPYFEVGIFYSLLNQEMKNEKLYYTQYEEEFMGAYKMLTEMHIPFDVLTENRLRKEILDQMKVIIVPDVLYMSRHTAEIFREYVKRGGILVYSYRSFTREPYGLEKQEDGLNFINIEMESPYNYHFCSSFGGMKMSFMRINNGCVYITPKENESYEIISNVYLPAFDCGKDKWVSHNVQPGKKTLYPGAVTGTYGEGRYIYYSFKIFTEYLQQGLAEYRRAFESILMKYYATDIKIYAPSCVEVNFMEKGDQWIVVLTNCTVSRPAGDYRNGMGSYHVNLDEVIPIHDIKLEFASNIRLKTAESLKSGMLERVRGNTFILKKLNIFDVLILGKEL
jgi:Beta-galactosidase